MILVDRFLHISICISLYFFLRDVSLPGFMIHFISFPIYLLISSFLGMPSERLDEIPSRRGHSGSTFGSIEDDFRVHPTYTEPPFSKQPSSALPPVSSENSPSTVRLVSTSIPVPNLSHIAVLEEQVVYKSIVRFLGSFICLVPLSSFLLWLKCFYTMLG